MKKILVHVLGSLLMSGSLFAQTLKVGTPETVGVSTERINQITQLMQSYVDRHQIAGSVALIARKNQIVYYGSVGKSNIEKNIPLEKEAIFRIASQTKAIVSVGIMMLQERGKLHLLDKVSKFIPEFKNTTVAIPNAQGEGYQIVKAEREITLRDLLTHTAGIGYGYETATDLWKKAGLQGWYFANREEPILETVKRIPSVPFASQPGKQFVYGYNTDILGAVIEVVSGQSLKDFLQENILDPLEMHDTYFYVPKSKKVRLASVYRPTKNGIERSPEESNMEGQGEYVMEEGPNKSYSGGAGFLSTAMDYAHFLTMMLNKGTYNGNRILSRKSVELMTVDHLEKATFPWVGGTGFGLGFSIVKDLGKKGALGSVGEYGWGGAYHSTYWVDPKEELIVVYFTQLIPSGGIDDHEMLRTQVYQSIID